MKTLIVSMLRLGDLFQHMKLVEMFSAQQALGEIHWLIDESSAHAGEILKTKAHVFPRSSAQKILVQRQAHPQRAIRLVKDVLKAINSERYDLVLNLTHTRVAVQLLDAVQAGEIRGGRQDLKANPHFRMLNDVADQKIDPPQIYARMLTAGLGFEWDLPLEKEDVFPRRGLALHLFSQDEKKNWNLDHWKTILHFLKKKFPNELIYLLGSPQQAQSLHQLAAPGVEICCEGIATTQRLLSHVRALIGIDSSMAHLAATVDTPSYLLYLGSANQRKIIPLQEDSQILSGKSPCFPCQHQSNCGQHSHLCGESLSVTEVEHFLTQCFSAGESRPAVSLGNFFAGL